MKILLAPNAFKECLSALEVAQAMAEGVREVYPGAECVLCPIADGGDGTLETLIATADAKPVQVKVADPLGRPVKAKMAMMGGGNGMVIEMAEASGLHLLKPEERNPLITTTRGTGDLIRVAIYRGVRYIIVGIGGSATVDGGTGMARALGYRFLDQEGNELPEGGGSLSQLEQIDFSGKEAGLASTRILIASDVTNPLLGNQGAAQIYGPQKGATPEQVEQLESGLKRLADIIQKDLGIDVRDCPGAGAAGGLGAGLMAFTNATLHPGIDLVMRETGFLEKLDEADLVITGEGSVDRQTAFGKGPAGVAKEAKERGIPVYLLAGKVEEDAEEALKDIGITHTLCINPPDSSLEESLREAPSRLREATIRILKQQ